MGSIHDGSFDGPDLDDENSSDFEIIDLVLKDPDEQRYSSIKVVWAYWLENIETIFKYH